MKPSLPQGTRDFNAEVIRRRRFILDTIKEVFELYGFEPLETPAMENLETLMGKYGDEGDKLIFQVLDSGEKFSKNFASGITNEDFLKAFWNYVKDIAGDLKIGTFNQTLIPYISKWLSTDTWIQKKYLPNLKNEISEKALRYDLTIPFARYVAMNFAQLTMPYKRYQMQPVWRADRPQKGRYREFYQCDADIAGTTSLMSDAELALIYCKVFEKLNIDVEVKINSRKILSALAEACDATDKFNIITAAIDKLDKIGIKKVKEELQQRELNETQISIIEKYLSIGGTNDEKIIRAKKLFEQNETAKKGIEEIEFLLKRTSQIIVDFTLARGLNYYTGIIYEVKAKNVSIGSIGGGGRYDDLTGLFGLPNIPGVGISFGVDRIYDVMTELNLFPETINTSTKVLFFNLGEQESLAAFTAMQTLRNNGISCELFYETAKMDKQFKYANKKNIAYAIIIGSRELEQQTCIIKDLQKEEQQPIKIKDLLSYFDK